MVIPTASNYPDTLDDVENLHSVHDGLRVTLAEDYNPGDTSIQIVGDDETIRRFPNSGIITLTEQCSDPEERAISFFYGVRSLQSFAELELLPGFPDVAKPKKITNVTQNVMAVHHNAIKDALIAIEEFAGKEGETALRPLEGTMEERINLLRQLVLRPKAWFAADKTIGIVPLTVEFRDLSFRLGTDGTAGPIEFFWDFGDNTDVSLTTITATDEVPVESTNVIVEDLDGGTIKKTYTTPGIFDVTLVVRNDFGEDTVIFPDFINARVTAPDPAVIEYAARLSQILIPGIPAGGPFTTPPVIRSSTNVPIDIEIESGINPATGRTFAGEEVDEGGIPIDPITSFSWEIADDLAHGNSPATRSSFSIGGIFDLILRVDTEFGAYRITTYENTFDIVENTNLWLWNFTSSTVRSFEFGLISETFKAASSSSLDVIKDDSFLDGIANEEQQKREFNRNNGFSQRGTNTSGAGGLGLLYWASGRLAVESAALEKINFVEFNGFEDTYLAKDPIFRPWNWLSLDAPLTTYFFLGNVTDPILADTSPTNQTLDKLDLASLTVDSSSFPVGNYKNGADELRQNISTFTGGEPDFGHMSVYRTTWREDTGFILRNDGVGNFFRIKSFYRTSGNTSEPFQDIRKLPDMSGPAKLEGQLVALSTGVFFFNNSGSISAFNPVSGIWETGGPGVNSSSFRLLQDTDVIGFDSREQTFLATSDKDKRAYLSFEI